MILIWGTPEWATGEPGRFLLPLLPRGGRGEVPKVTAYRGRGDSRARGRVSFNVTHERAFLAMTKDPIPVVLEVAEGGVVIASLKSQLTTPAVPQLQASEGAANELGGGDLAGRIQMALIPGLPTMAKYSLTSDGSGREDVEATVQLLEALHRGGTLAVTAPGQKRSVLYTDVRVLVPAPLEEIRPIVLLSHWLSLINTRLGMELSFSDGQTVLGEEARALERVATGVKLGTVKERLTSPVRIATDREGALHLVDLLSRDPPAVSGDDGRCVAIFGGTEIDPGPVRMVWHAPRLMEDATSLRQRLETMSVDEDVEVEFQCGWLIWEFLDFIAAPAGHGSG